MIQVGINGPGGRGCAGILLIAASILRLSGLGARRDLYGLVVLIFEIVNLFNHKTFHLGPVIFGLAFSLLLIAAYPERKRLLRDVVPTGESSKPSTEETPAETPALEAAEPEKAS
jgi:hypothetical protein